jgi:SAM-dependent methyltransferase
MGMGYFTEWKENHLMFTLKKRLELMERYWKRDATQVYREQIEAFVKPGMTLLHAGCGWDKHNISRPYREECHVIGIDIDPRVESMFHSEFHLASLDSLPFPDEYFDAIVSEYVFEHLDNPNTIFREMARVLKPNGTIYILTPNLFSYKGLGACFTPQWFHLFMGRIRYGRGHEADMYPTRYQCNTASRFKRFAKNNNLKVASIQWITNGPTWFTKFPVLFEIGHLYHQLIASHELFRHLRCALLVSLRKQQAKSV